MLKKWLPVLASYARCVALAVVTAIMVMGHIPADQGEWVLVAKAAALALGPVIIRWLNPNDKAYGRGVK